MLSFEDWLKLSEKEKGERYSELSDEDKFKVRQGFYFDTSEKEIDESTPLMQEINKLWNEIKDDEK